MIVLIPVISVSGKRGGFTSGSLSFKKGKPYLSDTESLLENVKRQCANSDTVAILDVDGFSSRSMNGDIIKELKIKGRTTILITGIETLDDVFDALCSNFDMIALPYHMAEEDLLSEALEISDSVIMAGFFENGKEILTGATEEKFISENRNDKGEVLTFDINKCELTLHMSFEIIE